MALHKALAGGAHVVATRRLASEQGPGLDMSRPQDIEPLVKTTKPELVINATAYTAVDRAEEDRSGAWLVNSDAVWELASTSARLGIPLVHFSTDYVFSGGSRPYRETDPVAPINHYGVTKFAGEEAIRISGGAYLIFRTSWLYGPDSRNFLTTIHQKALQGEPLKVVDDQIGQPTSVESIAKNISALITRVGCGGLARCAGTYHFSSTGQCSWFEYAQRIVACNGCSDVPVDPIKSDALNAAAKRPAYSVLDTTKAKSVLGIQLPHWSDDVESTVAALRSRLSS